MLPSSSRPQLSLTELPQSERPLGELLAGAQWLCDALGDGLIVVEEGGLVASISPRAVVLLGGDCAAAVGRPLVQLLRVVPAETGGGHLLLGQTGERRTVVGSALASLGASHARLLVVRSSERRSGTSVGAESSTAAQGGVASEAPTGSGAPSPSPAPVSSTGGALGRSRDPRDELSGLLEGHRRVTGRALASLSDALLAGAVGGRTAAAARDGVVAEAPPGWESPSGTARALQALRQVLAPATERVQLGGLVEALLVALEPSLRGGVRLVHQSREQPTGQVAASLGALLLALLQHAIEGARIAGLDSPLTLSVSMGPEARALLSLRAPELAWPELDPSRRLLCERLAVSAGARIRQHREEGTLGVEILVSAPLLSETTASAVAHPSPSAARRGRILAVDDEPFIATLIQRSLQPQHEVTTALSGSAALQLLADDQGFDLILCDLSMPDMSGIELFERLRLHVPALAERVVFLTGGAVTKRASDFLSQSGRPRIEKPFSLEALRALADERVRRAST